MVIITITSVSNAQVRVKWSEKEHADLGANGTTLACLELGIARETCPNRKIYRGDRKVSFSYGQIVTSADFYRGPKEFIKDNIVGRPNFIRFLDAVSHNYNHFGWNNIVDYVRYHSQALKLAQKSYELAASDIEMSRAYLNEALIYNAFADHYLTDGFASGHIRIPRIQIKEWAKDNLFGLIKDKRGDFLSKYLHDIESKNLRNNKELGLRVENSRGNIWYTRGDGNLKSVKKETDLASMLPERAVIESFKEILIAATTGEIPVGVYSATEFVPFQRDMPLTEKLSPGYQKLKNKREVIELIYSSLEFVDKLTFGKNDFSAMLKSLSKIFTKFRADVAHDQQTNPALKQHLPEKYLQAYLVVE